MITVKSYRFDYSANFYDDFEFLKDLADNENIFSIIDERICSLYVEEVKPFLNKPHYIISATEENKTIDGMLPIIDQLVLMDSKKKTIIVAIGGGIIQDIACFISSVLYRGVRWYLVPTTLLAQTDSCIGSKSSINYNKYKNLLGTFYPPTEIFVCTGFQNTLNDRDFKSGLGEVAKCLLMDSKSNFEDFCKDLPMILERKENELIKKHMIRALSFKKKIIEQDEFDSGIRNIMNYGHTFGHALESITNYAIPHGQGVSIGLLIANEISMERGMITKDYRDYIFDNVSKIISEEFKNGTVQISVEKMIDSMKMDKKYDGAHNCILLTDNGAIKIKGITNEEITKSAIAVMNKLKE